MRNKKMETKHAAGCPHCEAREKEELESEELNFAVLIALMPVLTITLLSNMGLF
jgi:hypothetical protein